MEVNIEKWYQVLAPRVTGIVSTIDEKGISNAAPISFVSPVSSVPPLVMIALAPKRHTLENIRKTKEFILNLPPEKILKELMVCAKPFPKGVSEIKESGLTEIKSKKVKVPRIAECLGWIECKFIDEYTVGDHIIVIGEVLISEIKDEFWENGFLVGKAKPLLHLTGNTFAVAERTLKAE